MGLRVNQNIAAMNAYRNLSVTDGQMNKSLEKLSSGFRINRAADDAAGLSISEGLRSQVGGLKVAVRNAQDGISVVQTAEGALSETTSILQRMRDLSVQASNEGGLSADAKGNIQSEITELKDELDRIANTTEFNGTKLLDGNYKGVFQVGANAGQTIDVDVDTAMTSAGLGVSGVNVTTGAYQSVEAPGTVDYAATTAPTNSAYTVTVGADTYTLELNSKWDTAGTAEAAKKNHTLVQTQLSEKLDGTGITATADEFGGLTFSTADNTKTLSTSAALGSVSETSAADWGAASGTGGAQAAITAINDAIETVSGVRSELGAKQNRFDHTINNLNVAVENLSASESRIRDTDMAQEMVSFTRNQILTQAGTAMLAQANQASQGVLSLLR